MAYGFISDESEATYQWFLKRLKDVIQPNTDGSMPVFVTNKCRALMKKLDIVFPDSAKLFCIWHMMNNIRSNLIRGWFKSKKKQK